MKWFNNQKVSVKIFLSCMVFTVLIVAIAVQGVISMSTSASAFDSFYADRFVPVRNLNKIFKGIMQARIDMLQIGNCMKTGTTEAMNEAEKRIESVEAIKKINVKLWDEFMATDQDNEEKRIAEKFDEYHKLLVTVFGKFMDAVKLSRFEDAEKYSDEWLVLYRQAKEIMDELIGYQQSIGEKIRLEQQAAARNTLMLLLGFLVVVIGVSIAITYILSRSVSIPVNKGLEFAQKLAKGDLTERVSLDQKDELGKLASELNSAADNLENLIANVITGTQGLAQAVEQIAGGNQNLSQRTSEQASSLEEIASTIEETTATIRQNAENAVQANKQSVDTTKMAEEGGKIVYEAVASINAINQSSKKIADIISMINEIAFQTNLLALNAAVEAARAGEQGRGFAVVAGEVRNLAQRAAAASKEISGLIQDSVEKIDNGTELVNKSGEALKEITESVMNVGKLISEIAAASQEQKQGVDQINVAVSEMDTMTQQNAALVEETASASEEMANQAQDLLALVEKFRVRKEVSQGFSSGSTGKIHLKSADMYKSNTKSRLNKSENDGLKTIHEIASGETSRSENSVPHNIKQAMSDEGFDEF